MRKLLWSSVQEALGSLGEPTMQSLTWHMNRTGVPMEPESFDVKRFYAALFELTGEGADVLLDLVAKRMIEKLKMDDNFGKNFSGIERVLKILETAEKVKG